jgi:glutamate---cysteine ligase / carboxylate-amine ligase
MGTLVRADFTVGIEEEMFLVDAGTLDCVTEMPEPFRIEAERKLGSHFQREMTASMIEVVSGCHDRLETLASEQLELRSELSHIASRHGLAIMACGTHPFSDWHEQSITPQKRYADLAEAVRLPALRSHACGLHVHVEVPGDLDRVTIMSRLRSHLPLLLALSTSSPFWRGQLTGVKSYRTLVNNEMPRSGLPTHFRDEAEYEQFVASLVNADLIPDESYLWWAVRPSRRYPTLELRISDCCTRLDDALAIAGIYRALVHHLCRYPTCAGAPDAGSDLIVEENRWQAARLGTAARFVNPEDARPETVPDTLNRLLTTIAESVEAVAAEPAVIRAGQILTRGTSAERQEQVYHTAIREGRSETEALATVSRHLIAEFRKFELIPLSRS